MARIIHASHDIDVITDGNQKCRGAMPSLSKMAEINIIFIKFIDLEDQWAILLISISLDPSAWAMKYLIAASVSWLVLELVINGMNLSILISIDIHRKSQLVLDIAIIVLISKDKIIRSWNGLFR